MGNSNLSRLDKKEVNVNSSVEKFKSKGKTALMTVLLGTSLLGAPKEAKAYVHSYSYGSTGSYEGDVYKSSSKDDKFNKHITFLLDWNGGTSRENNAKLDSHNKLLSNDFSGFSQEKLSSVEKDIDMYFKGLWNKSYNIGNFLTEYSKILEKHDCQSVSEKILMTYLDQSLLPSAIINDFLKEFESVYKGESLNKLQIMEDVYKQKGKITDQDIIDNFPEFYNQMKDYNAFSITAYSAMGLFVLLMIYSTIRTIKRMAED